MNSRRLFSAAAVVVAACLILPGIASAGPLRGWWPLNERSGQTVYDWSGNGNHGKLGSTPGADENDPTWIKGIFNIGSALRFDGNDYLTIPDDSSLRPARLTVSAWLRSDREGGPGPYNYFVAKGAAGCLGSSFALYTTEWGELSFYIYDGTAWVRSPDAPISTTWDGKWHHVAGTYDGATLRLFVDGKQIGSGTAVSSAIEYDLPSPDATFGSFAGSCPLYLTGDIDGVSVWDRALPIGDIKGIIGALIGGR